MLLVFYLSLMSHEFHVSTTVVEYKQEQNTLQITAQTFIDDLESALRLDHPEIRLAPDSDAEKINQLLAHYFTKNMNLESANVRLPLQYLGKEYKNDIAVHYIELKLEDVLLDLKIENRILLSLFDDQKNIVHFKQEQNRKSFLLDKNNPYIRFDLDPLNQKE